MFFHRTLLSILAFFALYSCEKQSHLSHDYYLSLKQAKEKHLLIAEYTLKNMTTYTKAKFAYAYQLPSTQGEIALLVKTHLNIEVQGKYLALSKQGNTGKAIATDSTYLMILPEYWLSNKNEFTLYEFAIEKPDKTYQLNVSDSLILEKIPFSK